MICKTFKWMLLSGAVLGGAGFLFLGTALPKREWARNAGFGAGPAIDACRATVHSRDFLK